MGEEYQRFFQKCLKSIVRSAAHRREEEPEIIEVQKQLKFLHQKLQQGTVPYSAVTDELELLLKYFYLEIVPHPWKGIPVIAAFCDFMPLLDEISSTSKIDSAIYNEDLVKGDYPQRELPKFYSLDQKHPRQGLEWKINGFRVKPIQTYDELKVFIKPDSDFCFFDYHQNLAQIRLAAAHQFTQLLGIWEEQSEATRPYGVFPLFLFRHHGNEKKLPFLYTEAPMVLEPLKNLKDAIKRQNQDEELVQGLLDILPVYAAMQEPLPYLLIGSSRLLSRPHSPIVDRFVQRASERCSSFHFSNTTTSTPSIKTASKDPIYSKGKIESKVSLELPEDQVLIRCLQENGYRFPSTLMYTAAFVHDKSWLPNQLWSGWGIHKGISSAFISPEFHDFYQEILPEGYT